MGYKVLTDSNFNDEVLKSEKTVLVDFWAPWCGPCQMLGPIIEELANEYSETHVIGKLNVDENPTTANKYGILGIPTIIIFKNGQEVKRLSGVQPKEVLVNALNS